MYCISKKNKRKNVNVNEHFLGSIVSIMNVHSERNEVLVRDLENEIVSNISQRTNCDSMTVLWLTVLLQDQVGDYGFYFFFYL